MHETNSDSRVQQPILEALGLSKHYPIGGRRVTVLHELDLAVAQGEFLAIAGSSGSGKSTLLSLLAGLDRPSAGRVRVQGRDITDLPEEALAPLRNRCFGFVFQSFHLIPTLTALENAAFPAELAGDAEARPRARVLLERVGLAARTDNFPHQLSGGEKQRVALCRALINRPQLLFADEPTGSLDSASGEAVLTLMLELHHEFGATLLLVTHNAAIAERAGRVVELRDGHLVEERRRAA
jgi:putative ABC transport system ATP-binding protein